MPDESGRFRGMSVPAEAWDRIFGQGELFEREPVPFDQLVPPLDVEQPRRCGPWDEQEDGTHRCRKCGRLDPLDFDFEDSDE